MKSLTVRSTSRHKSENMEPQEFNENAPRIPKCQERSLDISKDALQSGAVKNGHEGATIKSRSFLPPTE